MENNVYLVRHAQSEANVDSAVLHDKTNMKVQLTALGRLQAEQTGVFLNDRFRGEDVIIWNSPFTRTRQTAEIIAAQMIDVKVQQEESVYLIERNFGLVDSQKNYFTDESNQGAIEYYKKHSKAGDEFFCVPPLGESPFQMAMRMHYFYNLYVESQKSIKHVIVSHGASLRGLNLMVMRQKYEKFLSPNPANASVNVMNIEGLKEIYAPSMKTY